MDTPTFTYEFDEILQQIKVAALPISQQIAQFKLKLVLFILIHVIGKTSAEEKSRRLKMIKQLKTLNIIGEADMNQVSSVAGRIYNKIMQPTIYKFVPPSSLLSIKEELNIVTDHTKNSTTIVDSVITKLEEHEISNLTHLRDVLQKYTALIGMYHYSPSLFLLAILLTCICKKMGT